MDGRRSYLDSLNAGRQRRPQNTLDELNRSLERLGERLERREEQPRGGFGREQERPRPAEQAPQRNTYEPPRPAMRPEREIPAPRAEVAATPPRDDAYLATTGRLAAEVKGLRDELRQQMTSGLQHEFENLRADISRAYAASAASGGKSSGKLAEELERITDSIQLLSDRSDDRGVNLLRLDLEQVKAEIDSLAREETLRSMDSRWDHFDRRWDDLEHRIDQRAKQDPGLSALNDRLQQITEAVHNLPESLSLKSLEDKVRTLAGSVDQFSRQQDDRTPQFFGVVEARLDEISRAIVASAVAAQPLPFDFEPIERIESRISALAYQLDELSNRGASGEIMERLNALSMRIDEVAQQADVPAKSVERLAGQIALIVDKIDAGSMLPNADEIMRGIENRFDQFAHALERRQDSAFENSQLMFRDLETRLYDVVSRLDQRPETPPADNTEIMEAIDARFDDFSRRLEARKADLLDRNTVRNLEAKIDTISNRIDNAPSALNIDADAIRNLESQVAGLSAHLTRPSQAEPIMDSLSPRLDQMEKAIRGNRDVVIDAARRAAEDVVRSLAGSNTDTAAVAGLAEDLKALESMSRRSDDRNAKTFEAIHDTLLKIVDRLGSIEGQGAPAPVKVTIGQAPSIETAEPADDVIGTPVAAPAMRMPKVEEFAPRIDTRAERAPARAALEPAVATVEAPVPETAKKRSMFSGIGRAFSGRKAAAQAAAPVVAPQVEAAVPKLDLDEPLDPKVSNRPLQPGSGAPDLSRIMKRVREERAQQPAKIEDADTGKSDFIAAARRAAQAAAAEAEVLKRHADIAGPGRGFKLGELLKTRRKPILMGATAIMIALAALQLSKALFADNPPAAAQANLATSPIDNPGAPASASAISAAKEGSDAKPADAIAAQPTDSADVRPAEQVRGADETMTMPAAAAMPEDMPMEPAGTEANAAATPEMPAAAATPDATGAVTASVAPMATQPEAPAAPAISVPDDAGPIALREAAETGDPAAMFEIGARYSDGRGSKADNKKAAEWYERAAEAGLAPAQYRIGNMYEKGVGVERDLKKAKTWYQMAAEQGNASAMHNLAVLYAMGADGTADNDSAARWFTQAGDLGVKDSQFNLGILNAKGIGMPQNLEESYKWFALVAKTGDRDAAAKRDEIANSLRPEQLEKARATTELWKPKAVDPAANVVDIPDAWKEGQEKTASVDMQKAVKTIQLILNKNGYDAGGADGVMGGKTKTAIMAFQKDNGMPANGEVTEKLVQELLARK